jgi:uncharacterized protein (DUF2164 family)
MTKIKRKWDILTDDQKQVAQREIIGFFQKELDQEIGIIIADKLLDFFQEMNFPATYNYAIEDSKKLLRQRFVDFEIDLDLLTNK